ncbi:MAG: restriction endonuclease subunit S [Elusimicrobiota bacterium]|jgi:type I restriction enzyme S subunit|nr:restriction endonuclease subunit S [Elusimicrobiota bacterium]
MSKIDELIKKHCPDGVEFKTLGEVCEFQRGISIAAKNVLAGNVPVIAVGQTATYYHNTANRTDETVSISSSGAYAGFANWLKTKFWAGAKDELLACCLTPFQSLLNI